VVVQPWAVSVTYGLATVADLVHTDDAPDAWHVLLHTLSETGRIG
jgi:hypothetical protein